MMEIIPPDAMRRVPWKNGRGTTLEVASDAHAPGEPWTWRVSIADVPESGPFSRFEGIERAILCVDGSGMSLVLDGAPPAAVPTSGPGLHFAGDAATEGILHAGPVRDANLMWRRGVWRGRLTLFRGRNSLVTEPTALSIVVALTGHASVRTGNGEFDLGERNGLRIRDEAVTLSSQGVLLLASLTSVVAEPASPMNDPMNAPMNDPTSDPTRDQGRTSPSGSARR